jgi:hypothetical protein
MTRLLACFLASCLLLNATCTRAEQSDCTETTARAGLPFKLSDGLLIVVEGRIGTLGKLKFILDTGATRSVVDRKVADKLHRLSG